MIAYAGAAALVVFSGCAGTNVAYSPKEHMVTVKSYNNFLEWGPCGMPWNHTEYFEILLQEGCESCQAAQLEMYGFGKYTIESGSVSVSQANRTITIDLTLLGSDDNVKHGPLKFRHNGIFRYVEHDPSKGEITREFLRKLYKDEEPGLYYPY